MIEALKQANGKCVTREIYRKEESDYFIESSPTSRLHWIGYPNDPLPTDHVLADDWYVVEPKSKIEEAIEREVADYFGVSPIESCRSQVAEAMRRVVNLTLDLAKAAAVTGNIKLVELDRETLARIDALKVKE